MNRTDVQFVLMMIWLLVWAPDNVAQAQPLTPPTFSVQQSVYLPSVSVGPPRYVGRWEHTTSGILRYIAGSCGIAMLYREDNGEVEALLDVAREGVDFSQYDEQKVVVQGVKWGYAYLNRCVGTCAYNVLYVHTLIPCGCTDESPLCKRQWTNPCAPTPPWATQTPKPPIPPTLRP